MQEDETDGKARQRRRRAIVNALQGWIPRNESVRGLEMLRAFNILPNSGGWLDQPAWFIHDVENLLLLEEFFELNADLVNTSGITAFSKLKG